MRMNSKISLALATLLAMLAACGGGGNSGSQNQVPGGVSPSISAQPANQQVITGQTAVFSITATGTAPLMYQWQKGGTSIVGATAASYTTPATTASDNNSTFTVVVSNQIGN